MKFKIKLNFGTITLKRYLLTLNNIYIFIYVNGQTLLGNNILSTCFVWGFYCRKPTDGTSGHCAWRTCFGQDKMFGSIGCHQACQMVSGLPIYLLLSSLAMFVIFAISKYDFFFNKIKLN